MKKIVRFIRRLFVKEDAFWSVNKVIEINDLLMKMSPKEKANLKIKYPEITKLIHEEFEKRLKNDEEVYRKHVS